MHPNTLQRIIDSELYGNEYSLSEFMGDLNESIFKADLSSDVNTFRQNLQAVYVTRLIEMINGKSASRFKIPAKSMAIYNLEEISKWLKKPAGNTSSVAHRNHIKLLISDVID